MCLSVPTRKRDKSYKMNNSQNIEPTFLLHYWYMSKTEHHVQIKYELLNIEGQHTLKLFCL